ncbi:Serine carboxypeptidase-like 11, partial [Mucuna pruriens]
MKLYFLREMQQSGEISILVNKWFLDFRSKFRNEIGIQPLINLQTMKIKLILTYFQGYLLGNPITTRKEKNEQIPFAHGMGLISDELYASLETNCKGEYTDVDSRNELCLRDLNYFDEARINVENILEPHCQTAFPVNQHKAQWRRSLTQKFEAILSCSVIFAYFLTVFVHNIGDDIISAQWANDESVRKALHIREGTIGKWERCYSTDFEYQIPSSFEFHVNLSAKGYRSLIYSFLIAIGVLFYSGDHDAVVPFISTQAWIRALNYSIVEDWRPWFSEGQVAGYTRIYSNQMTFATVKGAGHITSIFKPEECFAMFTRWIANVPL